MQSASCASCVGAVFSVEDIDGSVIFDFLTQICFTFHSLRLLRVEDDEESGLIVKLPSYQVVLMAGVACCVVEPQALHSWPRVSFSSEDHTVITAFAEKSIATLKTNFPYVTCDGLVSVDVMQRKSGQLVIKEVHSLETNLFYKDFDQQLVMTQTVTDFWVGIIEAVVISL